MADILNRAAAILALPAFLRRQAQVGFSWGMSDCGLFLADWSIICGYADPAASVRGRYDTEESCLAVCGAGTFGEAIAMIAASAGLSETAVPQNGDAALIDISGVGETGGVMTAGSWAFRTLDGIAWSRVSPGRVVKAWCIPTDVGP